MENAQTKAAEAATNSNWTGSEKTFERVRAQIAKRWGAEEAQKYDPRQNCLTFSGWHKRGFIVRKGEKALKSFIVVERKDKETGKVESKRLKTINLFYEKQVVPVEVE